LLVSFALARNFVEIVLPETGTSTCPMVQWRCYRLYFIQAHSRDRPPPSPSYTETSHYESAIYWHITSASKGGCLHELLGLRRLLPYHFSIQIHLQPPVSYRMGSASVIYLPERARRPIASVLSAQVTLGTQTNQSLAFLFQTYRRPPFSFLSRKPFFKSTTFGVSSQTFGP
jgi:hypothetical protein